MKLVLIFISIALFNFWELMGQEQPTGGTLELYLLTEGGDGNMIFYLTALSNVWDENFYLTSNNNYLNSSEIVPPNYSLWDKGWDFVTTPNSDKGGVAFGFGLYKLYTNESASFIYLDYRDCNYYDGYENGNNDKWIKYNASNNTFSHYSSNMPAFQTLENGHISRIWENDNSVPSTSCFTNFWSNCLVMTENSGFPQIVWGPHPTFTPISGYKIYRKVVLHGYSPGNPLSYSLLATVSSSTFSYIDLEYTTGGEYYDVYYYVKAYYNSTLSGSTNIVGTSVNNNNYKATTPQNNYTKTESYLLNSYPNPFNPTTKIEYQIPQAGQVSIKVYNSLGSEVATLVNERQDEGKYSVEFDGSNLTSGIYFCVFKSGNHISTNKMLLVK